MAMWDSVLLAYADRSRLIPPGYRRLVTRMNGDVLPTLLVDGYVAGVWRAVQDGIEATAFHLWMASHGRGSRPKRGRWCRCWRIANLEVYGRYHHWWAKLAGAELPDAETRLLPGV